jgi:hypothetical protein
MSNASTVASTACAFLAAASLAFAGFRPPAVPLVTHDPYFSIWSPADHLTDAWPMHWTGATHALASMIRVDGKALRLMGVEPAAAPAMNQERVLVLPTRSVYTFRSPEVQVTLTFMSPLLPQDLDVLSRPVTYLTWEVQSVDGKKHDVAVYYDNTAEIAVNGSDQRVVWSRPKIKGLTVLSVGSQYQPVLEKKGDNLRIDWGYLYAATGNVSGVRAAVAPHDAARSRFLEGKPLPEADDPDAPRRAEDRWPVLAFTFSLGAVGETPVSRHLMLAYDDLYSIEYFGTPLRPYWRRNGAEAADLLKAAARDYDSLLRKCGEFDEALMSDLEKAGGAEYAQIAALAYRQCLAGNKLAADANGMPLLFPKENTSNGCVSTVDVLYPMSPLFLALSPALMKASLVPVLDYANSPRWKFPFAPHDLGAYPVVAGQVYGGGERDETNQMPVEECGNMLLVTAAVAKVENSADFAARYWPLMTRWAEYLEGKGFDPENQLCTDDFAGHLAHNANLSAKAVLALGAYAMLCKMQGKDEEARKYRDTAEGFARKWIEVADDGDHYRLAFDKPGTWSQKYNLVWDRILDLGLFPEAVKEKETAFYLKTQKRYGLPLDSRDRYTKTDWTTWSAMLTGSRPNFEVLVRPVHAFLNETPDRVPMSDWYMTNTGRTRGMHTRPVIGGVFLKLMEEPERWNEWVRHSEKVKGNWAAQPAPSAKQ